MKSYFKNFNIIDTINSEVLYHKAMIIEDKTIIKILDDNRYQEDVFDEVIDLNNNFIMSGLIDCHVHVFMDPARELAAFNPFKNPVAGTAIAIKNLNRLIKSGVTYIRDLGSIKGYDVNLRELVKSGYIMGPEMKCSGQFITMTGGHGYKFGREADGVEEVRKATRESIKLGADIIKLAASGGVITPGNDINAYQFNEEELRAAVIEGHKANKKVATHAHSKEAIKNSILAGVDSVEHGSFIDDECINLMVNQGTYLVPTLKASYSIVKAYEEGTGMVDYETYKKAKALHSNQGDSVYKAYKAGVKMAMGTDCGVPGNIFGSNYEELLLMKNCNIAIKDILKIATINSAELLNISDEYGSIEENKIADFIVLSENPFENLETIKDLVSVYKNGKLVQ